MPIRRIAVLGAVFSAATGTWLIAMPSTAEAQPSIPLQAACVPWPYRPCPPPPPPPPPPFCPPCDHDRDHDRDRGYREDEEAGGGYSESEEYEEYEQEYREQQRSRERTLTRIDTPRVAPPPQAPEREAVLPATGASVALLGATSLALITGGTLVLYRRRRRCGYDY